MGCGAGVVEGCGLVGHGGGVILFGGTLSGTVYQACVYTQGMQFPGIHQWESVTSSG